MEEASRRKGKEPTKESPPRETERHKIQREEEQGNSQPPPEPEREKIEEERGITGTLEEESDDRITKSKERFYKEKEGLLRLHRALQVVGGPRVEGYDLDLIDLRREYRAPEPEPEKIHSEEQGSSPPPPSEQTNTRWFPSSWGSWATFPREQDSPANWITDDCGEWRSRYDCTVAPYYRTPDPEAPQYLDDMFAFYQEAARRLPIAQMPELAGVLSRGGLLLGFNDPVTNIIVNAIFFMGKISDFGVLPPGTDPARHAADRASYVDIARRSRAALVVFMVFYFLHLTQAQAKRYLRAARHDLALAIRLVEWHRTVSHEPSDVLNYQLDEVWPDCNRTKTAVRYASGAAMMLSDHHDFVRLVASRYPWHLLDTVLDDLRRGEQLSVGRVKDISNLLQQPWSPPPPLPAPTPGTFRDPQGNVTIIVNIGQDLFSTTTITSDRVAAFNNNKRKGGIVTTSTISRHPSCRRDDEDDMAAAASHLSTGSDTESRLRALLSNTTALQLQLQPNTKSLKLCLLDMPIHGLYIQALAMLPTDHQPRLLRAMLAGGHCYGVMEDPISNIVVNSIWYNARFPHPETAADDYDLIKATSSMTRAESSSLEGLIAILRADRGITEQEAVACLCTNRRNLSQLMTTMRRSLNQHSLAAAAKAAKHPQPAALVAFLTTFLTPEKCVRLRSLLNAKPALSNADFTELSSMIAGYDVAPAEVKRMAATPDPGKSAFNTMPAARVGGFGTPSAVPLFNFKTVPPAVQSTGFSFNTVPAAPVQRQSFLRTRVEELLLDYGHPMGPHYKLGVICGVALRFFSRQNRGTTCYHVNFLASKPADIANDDTFSPPECMLFFAQFCDPALDNFEPSEKPPVCCPIQDYHAFPGRCFICEENENAGVRVVHPPFGNYFMGHLVPTDTLCDIAEHHADLGP